MIAPLAALDHGVALHHGVGVEVPDELRAVDLIARLRRLDANEPDARFHAAASDVAAELATLLLESDSAPVLEVRIVSAVERTCDSTRLKSALVLAAGRSGRDTLTRWVARFLNDPFADPALRRAALLAIGPITNPSARRMYTAAAYMQRRERPAPTFRAEFARGPLERFKAALFRDVAVHDGDPVLRELCVLALGQAIDHDRDARRQLFAWLDLESRERVGLWPAVVFVLAHGQEPEHLAELSLRLDAMRAGSADDEARADLLVALADHQLSHATLQLCLDAAGDAELSAHSRIRLVSHLVPVLEDGRFEVGPWRAMVREELERLPLYARPGP